MPISSRIPPGGSGAPPLAQNPVPQDDYPVAPIPAGNGSAVTGTGALQGQQISVAVSGAAPEPGDVADLPTQVLQALAQPAQEQQRQMNAQLQAPPALTALYKPQPLSLASNARVIALLEAHALAAHTPLKRHEIAGYVALGERAIRAIEQIRKGEGNESTPMPARLSVAGATLTPNLEVMRAISWYVVACAAQQDANREAEGISNQIGDQVITDLTISGSYVFKDPHNALYDFMNLYPAVYSRISTHFNERSELPRSGSGKADQRGIEDYQNRLPGENGTILFDKLTQGDIFFKFEHAGMPTLAGAWQVDDQGQGAATSQQVLQRVMSHSLSFVWTLLFPTPGVERKEHVYKGLLEKEVYRPFLEMMQTSQAYGLLQEGGTPALHAKLSQNEGLPHLEKTLAQIRAQIDAGTEQTAELTQLLPALTALEQAIQHSKEQLGAQSNHLGIIRRGAETHVDLNPPRVHLKQALERFTAARAQSAVPPAVIHAETAQDWALHGVTINGVTYPGAQVENGMAPGVEGRQSMLEQAQRALVDICGGNALAADWISRFARQAQARPLVEYLRQESLGSVGSNLELMGGQGAFAIEPKAGGVELSWNFLYQKVGTAPLQIRQGENAPETMQDDATLKASVTLRFEGLATFVAGQAPTPTILQPLTYSLSNFNLALEGWDEISDFDLEDFAGERPSSAEND